MSEYESMMHSTTSIPKLPHHEQLEFCMTRAKYRQGRKLTAVRVYTVNDESNYLILNGVPAIKISNELEMLCQRYGEIEYLKLLPDYPNEEYVEVYLVKYRVLKNARFAKRQLDGKCYYGQVLHVCYAPELESVDETRKKLQERRKIIAALTRYSQDPSAVNFIKKTKVMPPTATRYISQLRPDLKEENLSRLHHRVDKPLTRNTGLGQEVHGDSQEVSWPLSDTSKVCLGVFDESKGSVASLTTMTDNSSPKTEDHYKVSGLAAEPIEEGQIVNVRKKGSNESCTVLKKKIKLFGQQKLLSFKQN